MRQLRWDHASRHSVWNVQTKRLEWPVDLFEDGRAKRTFCRGTLMSGIISTSKPLVLMGVYTRRGYQSAPTDRGVRIYIPIDSPRLQAPDTERPVIVADQHEPRLRLGSCSLDFIELAAERDPFDNFVCDYENAAEYIDPITLEGIEQPFQIHGHSYNLDGSEKGLDYARFLSGIRRVPASRQDCFTPQWRREIGLIKIGDKYCQEHNGFIIKVLDQDPLSVPISWSPGVLVEEEGGYIFVHARNSLYVLQKDDNDRIQLMTVKRKVPDYQFRSPEIRARLVAEP